MGNRSNGVISLTRPHTGHEEDDSIVNSKLARIDLKEKAKTSHVAPRDLIHEARCDYGAEAVVVAGSKSTLQRLISRAREEKCVDSEIANAPVPVFQGQMTIDEDDEQFMIFDLTCPSTQGRHVGFASKLQLETLEKSSILLCDGTFAVARHPFMQLWVLHATFESSTVPVVNILMSSRSISDYKFVLDEIRRFVPSWAPAEFIADLELGQSKAITDTFPTIKKSFCLFHLTQAWSRKLKSLKLDDLAARGSSLHPFWSLLKCIPFSPLASVHRDLEDILKLVPTPPPANFKEFENYLKKYYFDLNQNPKWPPISWNVVDRSLQGAPRTTNAVESHHRNLEKCIRDTKGRSTPLLSKLVNCLKQEAGTLKFDQESLDFDPSYVVSAERKVKDIMKDRRILAVVRNTPTLPQTPLTGISYLKAIRNAKKY